MEKKKFDATSYNVYTIKTNKFKSCYLEVVYRSEIDAKKVTARSALVDILMYSCKKFPRHKDLMTEYENLYNAKISASLNRVGKTVFTNFGLSFLNPKYTEEAMLDKSIELLFEVIENPNIANNSFDAETFKTVKESLEADILDEKSNALTFAIRRMFLNMAKNAPHSIRMTGNIADLNKLTPKNLVLEYNEMLNNDVCDIYFVGNIDGEKVAKKLEKYFHNITIKTKVPTLTIGSKKTPKLKVIKENDNFSQSYLIIGCDINNLTKKEKDATFILYNFILGAGSLENKLYKAVREEHSLCYNISSRYLKHDSLMLITSGIDKANYDLAVKLIKKAILDMRNGHISDKELENSKKLLVSALNMQDDTISTLVNNYVFQNIDELPEIEERIATIKNLTKKEVVAVAKKVHLNTIYFLEGGK